MGAAEGTKMDDDFVEMERVRKLKKFSPSDKYVIVNSWIFYLQKTDITYELVEDLQMKTKEFLQPNPTARAKMAAVKGKLRLFSISFCLPVVSFNADLLGP